MRDLEFEYGRADPVSPLIRRVIARNLGPFTYLGTGTYIVGHGEVAVIDPGPEMSDHLAAIVAATAGERVTHILVTHHHLDHSPLARPLAAATGATIYGCASPAATAQGEIKLEAGPAAFTLATFTGGSRIFYHDHWFTDCLTGAAIGTVSGLAVARWHERHP